MKVPRRSARSLLVTALATLLVITGSPSPVEARAAAVDDGRLNVLLFYKSNFHASHVQARQAVRDLATQLGTQYNQPG